MVLCTTCSRKRLQSQVLPGSDGLPLSCRQTFGVTDDGCARPCFLDRGRRAVGISAWRRTPCSGRGRTAVR
ncbi:hypothetical protein BN1263530008 [Stenotrophomonas indicatrix]|nr:hypothetical protein BN1263530008 [Stenotrophomonas indicatrix]